MKKLPAWIFILQRLEEEVKKGNGKLNVGFAKKEGGDSMEAKSVLALVDAGFGKDEINQFDEEQIEEVIRLLDAGYKKDEICDMEW